MADNRNVHKAMYLIVEGYLLGHVREAQIAADVGDTWRVLEHHEKAQALLASIKKAQLQSTIPCNRTSPNPIGTTGLPDS